MQRISILASVTASLLLAACGGGGGGSGINSPAPAGSPSTGILNGPVASAYTGEARSAFNVFNIARLACGFGALQQNTLIDQAALNHVTWLVENNNSTSLPNFSHLETAGTPGFTGVYPGDRLTAAGYTWMGYAEVMTAQTGGSITGFGLQGARNLLAAPYHLLGLMQGNREIGVSVKSGGPFGSGADITYSSAVNAQWFVADMASSPTLPQQNQAAADVLTYPCQGVTNTAYKLSNESPNPLAPRDLAALPVGQPVFVQVLAGNSLAVSSATMTRTSDGSPVVLAVILTASNDPNHELQPNQAIIIPNAPLSPNTQYSVNLQGSNNGSAFQKSFSFSTGS